jgi:hypothetical protein
VAQERIRNTHSKERLRKRKSDYYWSRAVREILGCDECERLIAQVHEEIEARKRLTPRERRREAWMDNKACERARAQRTVEAWLANKAQERARTKT